MFSVQPSPPRNVRVVEVFKDFVVLSWTAPASDGGEKIVSYEIEKSLGGAPYVSAGYVDGSTFQHKVVRLREGGEYSFRISAENRIGKSKPTATQSPVICKLPYGKEEHYLLILFLCVVFCQSFLVLPCFTSPCFILPTVYSVYLILT